MTTQAKNVDRRDRNEMIGKLHIGKLTIYLTINYLYYLIILDKLIKFDADGNSNKN